MPLGTAFGELDLTGLRLLCHMAVIQQYTANLPTHLRFENILADHLNAEAKRRFGLKRTADEAFGTGTELLVRLGAAD